MCHGDLASELVGADVDHHGRELRGFLKLADELAMARRRRARRCACRRGWNEREPSAGGRTAAKQKRAKSKSATTSPRVAAHDRPEDVAATSPAGAATGARTSLGAGVVPRRTRASTGLVLLARFLGGRARLPCGGRRRILRDVTAPTAVVALLEHLGLPARAPPLAAARSPRGSTRRDRGSNRAGTRAKAVGVRRAAQGCPAASGTSKSLGARPRTSPLKPLRTRSAWLSYPLGQHRGHVRSGRSSVLLLDSADQAQIIVDEALGSVLDGWAADIGRRRSTRSARVCARHGLGLPASSVSSTSFTR